MDLLFLLILQHRQAGSWALTHCHVTNMCNFMFCMHVRELANELRRHSDSLSEDYYTQCNSS
jgi:histidinol phosphatase-like enzyme